MPLSRRTAVRLLAGLLVLAALGGGLWWIATRLNETERNLVGAWHDTTVFQALLGIPRSGVVFLSDRRQFSIREEVDADGMLRWTVQGGHSRWSATPEKIMEREIPAYPASLSFDNLRTYVEVRWYAPVIHQRELSKLTDDHFTWQTPGWNAREQRWQSMRRLTNPEVLRLVQRLESGDLP